MHPARAREGCQAGRMATPQAGRTREVADGVHLVTGTGVNWVIVAGSDGCTLVDTGYRGDRARLVSSLADLGFQPGDVAAVLLTHGHLDHIGSAQWLAERHGVPVLTGAAEVANVRREVTEQITPAESLLLARTPRGAGWLARSLLATRGSLGLAAPAARSAEPSLDADGALDVPGRPRPLVTPGHTSGHTCWWLPERGVLLTGDALVTGHDVCPGRGPQLLPAAFHHDADRAASVLAELTGLAGLTGADDEVVVVPGHGEAWTGTTTQAVRTALQRRV